MYASGPMGSLIVIVSSFPTNPIENFVSKYIQSNKVSCVKIGVYLRHLVTPTKSNIFQSFLSCNHFYAQLNDKVQWFPSCYRYFILIKSPYWVNFVFFHPFQVDLLYNGDPDSILENDLTLVDVAFIFNWKNKVRKKISSGKLLQINRICFVVVENYHIALHYCLKW